MKVITDAPDYAVSLLGTLDDAPEGPFYERHELSSGQPCALTKAFFSRPTAVLSAPIRASRWRQMIVSGFATGSQYDRLIGLAREKTLLPDGLACFARTGVGLQGFHGRSWVAAPGNVHLSVHLAPDRRIERFETVFMALAALAVIEAIDETADLRGRAGIKWVNDIVMDGAKVAGVLAYSQTRGDHVTSVVLGIGLNVECSPTVAPTAFVPRAACLRDFSALPATIHVGDLLRRILVALERNYALLLRDGFRPIMQGYREHSIILGREVAISSDDADEVPRIVAAGRARAISDGMELYLDGVERPINRGRLILSSTSDGAVIDRSPSDVYLEIAS